MEQINKKAVAKQIFDEMSAAGKLVRKDVIARFMAEAQLTQAGASTYFFNFKNQWSDKAEAEKAQAKKKTTVEPEVVTELNNLNMLFNKKTTVLEPEQIDEVDEMEVLCDEHEAVHMLTGS